MTQRPRKIMSAKVPMLPGRSVELAMAAPCAGVDEAGRGPLAGPVVAAAVVFGKASPPMGIADSKRLSAHRRAAIYDELMADPAIGAGVGVASVEEIDTLNILRATLLAMTRAVAALPMAPAHVLVDGNRLPDWAWPATAIIGGDSRELSIAAASIVAKTVRDRMMDDYAAIHPQYGWAQNRGYGTAEHLAALRIHGATPLHRRSFRPVAEALGSPVR